MNRRPLHFITREKESELIQKLLTIVDNSGYDPKQTAILMVSPDYSATVAMHLAHAWSVKGEIVPLVPVEVPYPTETHEHYAQLLEQQQATIKPFKQLVLVEAGIIRGGNWAWILDTLLSWGYTRESLTIGALCENVGSRTKSDYVGEYYDDNTHELMFYFERFNKNWMVR
jgi:hypothetical protein